MQAQLEFSRAQAQGRGFGASYLVDPITVSDASSDGAGPSNGGRHGSRAPGAQTCGKPIVGHSLSDLDGEGDAAMQEFLDGCIWGVGYGALNAPVPAVTAAAAAPVAAGGSSGGEQRHQQAPPTPELVPSTARCEPARRGTRGPSRPDGPQQASAN